MVILVRVWELQLGLAEKVTGAYKKSVHDKQLQQPIIFDYRNK